MHEERDLRDMEPLSMPLGLFPPVSPASLESGLDECNGGVQEYCMVRAIFLSLLLSAETFF